METSSEVFASFLEGRWVDLSLLLSQDFPAYWPGHMPYQRKEWDWDDPKYLSRKGHYQTGWLAIDEHSGTHFDAPCHFIPPPGSGRPNEGPAGRITGDMVPLVRFHGRAAVIDQEPHMGDAGPGQSPLVSVDAVLAWESRNRELREGDVVLLRSDWERRYVAGEGGMNYAATAFIEKTESGWPAPSVELIEYVYGKGVMTIGTNSPSMGASHDGGPMHLVGLSKEMIFIEGLGNLYALPENGAYFIFLPLKVEGSSGNPGRAVGIIHGS